MKVCETFNLFVPGDIIVVFMTPELIEGIHPLRDMVVLYTLIEKHYILMERCKDSIFTVVSQILKESVWDLPAVAEKKAAGQ